LPSVFAASQTASRASFGSAYPGEPLLVLSLPAGVDAGEGESGVDSNTDP
jgi:hypothetical protein